MLKNFNFVNVPEGGVRHIVGDLGMVSIDDTLTDQIVEILIENGLDQYFEKKNEPAKPTAIAVKDAKADTK